MERAVSFVANADSGRSCNRHAVSLMFSYDRMFFVASVSSVNDNV